MATYTCTSSGFTISGSATITCQANGSWEPEPACTMGRELLSECIRLVQLRTLFCAAIDCGTPPSVSNGSPGAPSPDTMLNGVVTYTCVSGYEVSTGVTTAMATCMANRVWEPVPTCQRTLYKNSITAFIFSIYTATRTKNSVDYHVLPSCTCSCMCVKYSHALLVLLACK